VQSSQSPDRKKHPKASKRPRNLLSRLSSAPAEEVEGLISEYRDHLSLADLRAVARNPYARAETLEALASVRGLTASYEARALLARHRRTPQVVAMRFVAGLFWQELKEIALDVRLAPPLRYLAEKYLLQRLPRMSIGERMTLSRRAPAETLARLCSDVDLRVLEAALENPRLTEERLIPFLLSPKTHPRRLQKVALHPRWSCCYEVRLALCHNPLTPLACSLPLLEFLRRQDLASLVASERVPSMVRFEASHLLEASNGELDEIESGPEIFDLETPESLI